KVKVINDLDTLIWNLNKKYLFELSQKQLSVIPTICVTSDDQDSLAELMKQLDSKQIVIKPVQSAGAWRTLRVNMDNMLEVDRDFSVWRQEQDFLVQPFMPEIMSEGEWSLIFFNGVFSHALIKRAKTGDFRVQSDHGGTVQGIEVSAALRMQAQTILNALECMPCYARVDGVMRDGQFLLMELELLEPELFLELEEHAPQRFAQAILARLTNSESH
ncbi:RimK family alpha-L-glutamate ligase, partial [Undibacterium sp.]|uniref:ATP-grasp domain-containing protein n=1 Tax=Undibacterium sp. TaxID=1914977 RepID=UPI003750C136